MSTGMTQRREIKQYGTELDAGWAWVVLIGCLLSRVIIGGIERSTGVLYLQFMDYFGRTAEETSWPVSISFTLTLRLGPLASALCNRFTVRTVVALGATLCSVGTLLSAFAPNIYWLYFSFGVLLGVGLALVYGPSLIILGQYFNRRRSLALGIATSGSPFSSIVFPAFLDWLFKHYSFLGAFIILSAIVSHLFICAVVYRPPKHLQRLDEQERSKRNPQSIYTIQQASSTDVMAESSDPADCEPTHCSIIRTKFSHLKHEQKENRKAKFYVDLSLLKNRAFLSLCIQVFLFSLSLNTILTYLPAITLDKGIATEHGAYLLSVMGICDGITRILVSICLDLERIRPHRLFIYNINIFCISVVTLAVPFMKTFLQFCAVSGLYGVSLGIYNSQKSVVCVDVLGVKHLTSSIGLLLAFQGLGSFITPAIGGFGKDSVGSYDIAFYVGSVGTFAGGAVMAVGNVWLYRRLRESDGYNQLQVL